MFHGEKFQFCAWCKSILTWDKRSLFLESLMVLTTYHNTDVSHPGNVIGSIEQPAGQVLMIGGAEFCTICEFSNSLVLCGGRRSDFRGRTHQSNPSPAPLMSLLESVTSNKPPQPIGAPHYDAPLRMACPTRPLWPECNRSVPVTARKGPD